MKVKLCVFVLITIIVSACNSGLDLQIAIDNAIKAGESELVILAGRYEIDESILLDGVENLTIKAESAGEVIITSGMEVTLDKFTCLNEEKGLYEITIPELISDLAVSQDVYGASERTM